jgi:hypothetical protein
VTCTPGVAWALLAACREPATSATNDDGADPETVRDTGARPTTAETGATLVTTSTGDTGSTATGDTGLECPEPAVVVPWATPVDARLLGTHPRADADLSITGYRANRFLGVDASGADFNGDGYSDLTATWWELNTPAPADTPTGLDIVFGPTPLGSFDELDVADVRYRDPAYAFRWVTPVDLALDGTAEVYFCDSVDCSFNEVSAVPGAFERDQMVRVATFSDYGPLGGPWSADSPQHAGVARDPLGDGIPDVWLGNVDVYRMDGPISNNPHELPTTTRFVDDAATYRRLRGDLELDDLDGDGVTDVLLSGFDVLQYGKAGTPGEQRGVVYVVPGPHVSGTSLAGDVATTIVRGLVDRSNVGAGMAAMGDTNGDGYGDIAYSSNNYAYDANPPGGAVAHVLLGPLPQGEVDPDCSETRIQGDPGMGIFTLAGADLDADSHRELVINVLGDTVWVEYAPFATGVLEADDIHLSFTDAGLVRVAGDTDGDGSDDLVLTDEFADGNAGEVWLFLGGTL